MSKKKKGQGFLSIRYPLFLTRCTIMQQMSNNMQVIAITHLPQIAAKGKNHYKVFKEEINGITTTNLKQLSDNERIVEIAEMLSGKNISNSALTHAKELLN